MDPTTADFNAWLAEEGAKIGATVPPQPSNLLAMYGTGYVPWLRSMAPEVRQVASGILSRLARTGTGIH